VIVGAHSIVEYHVKKRNRKNMKNKSLDEFEEMFVSVKCRSNIDKCGRWRTRHWETCMGKADLDDR
jgi:hypothetical protein